MFRYIQLCETPPTIFEYPAKMDKIDDIDQIDKIKNISETLYIESKECNDSFRNTHKKLGMKRCIRKGKEVYIETRVQKKSPDKLFEQFWELNKDLFYEPFIEPVSVVTDPKIDLSEKDTLYLKIDLTDKQSAQFHVKGIIEKYGKELKEVVSKAKFKIKKEQRFIQPEKLFLYRITYLYRKNHSRQETYDKLIELGLVEPRTDEEGGERDYDQEMRKISLYCAKVKKIIKNLESKNVSFI